MINSKRLFERILNLAQIGKNSSGGITRLSLTKEDLKARQLIKSFMVKAGLYVHQDQAGNIIGRLEGIKKNEPAIMTGSHIDTVANGGAFDGVLGVIAGIEVLQSIKESKIKTNHPLEVVVFTDEEGARFNLNLVGSRAMTSIFKDEYLNYSDEAGISMKNAMLNADIDAKMIAKAKRNDIHSFVELHIEQGQVLEKEGLAVGIVKGIAGPLWLNFAVTGQAAHAGATPMSIRQDPLPAAMHLIDYIFKETAKYKYCVATVGKIQLTPGNINVIPQKAEFTLDLRDIQEKNIQAMQDKINAYIKKFNKQNAIQIDCELIQKVSPVKCSPVVIKQMKKSFEMLKIKPFELISGAGHDSMNFGSICPMGMIFVRSQGGISHNPNECSTEDDCALGADLLYQTIINLDKIKTC